MKEIWKNIPNYNGYQVSSLGRIRTYNKTTKTKKHGIRHWKNRIIKPKGQTYKTGYRVDLWKNNKPHSKLVARLVAFTFYGKDINSKELTVNHIDGNRFNNNIENLELVSLKENIQKGFELGLYKFCKKIEIINKNENKKYFFKSMSDASKFINQSHGYISSKVKKNIFENDIYKWKIV